MQRLSFSFDQYIDRGEIFFNERKKNRGILYAKLYFIFLKPLLFVRGQFLRTVRKITIVTKLTLTIRRIVSTQNSFDKAHLLPFEHVLGPSTHTCHHATPRAAHTWLLSTKLGRAVGVVAVVPMGAMAFFKDVFAHGGLEVSRPVVVHAAHHTRGRGYHGGSTPVSKFLRPMGVLTSCHFDAVAIFGEGNTH